MMAKNIDKGITDANEDARTHIAGRAPARIPRSGRFEQVCFHGADGVVYHLVRSRKGSKRLREYFSIAAILSFIVDHFGVRSPEHHHHGPGLAFCRCNTAPYPVAVPSFTSATSRIDTGVPSGKAALTMMLLIRQWPLPTLCG